MKKKISVILPVYNVEKYLDRCIESVVNQTYDNLEIILVDDGSPDHCPQMCDDWAKKDKRIKVIHKKNGGVSSARNTALDSAGGDYITFVDADDYIAPNMVEKLINRAEADHSDVVVCGAVFDYGEYTENEKFDCDCVVYKDSEVLARYIAADIRAEIWAKLIKKEAVGGVRFDESIKFSEDILFNYYVFKNCSSVSCINDCLYYYDKTRENSATGTYLTDDIAQSYKTTKTIMLEQENTEFRDISIWRHMRKVFVILDKIVKSEDQYFFNTYYDIMKKEIFANKTKILGQKMYGPRQKAATLLLMLPREFAVPLIKKVL